MYRAVFSDRNRRADQAIRAIVYLADDTAEVTSHLLALLRKYPTGGKQIRDANIVATMLTYGVPTLLTHNIDDMRHFNREITIVPLHASAS